MTSFFKVDMLFFVRTNAFTEWHFEFYTFCNLHLQRFFNFHCVTYPDYMSLYTDAWLVQDRWTKGKWNTQHHLPLLLFYFIIFFYHTLCLLIFYIFDFMFWNHFISCTHLKGWELVKFDRSTHNVDEDVYQDYIRIVQILICSLTDTMYITGKFFTRYFAKSLKVWKFCIIWIYYWIYKIKDLLKILYYRCLRSLE